MPHWGPQPDTEVYKALQGAKENRKRLEKLFNQESKLSDEDCRAWIIGKWKQKFSSGGGGTARDTDIITFKKDGTASYTWTITWPKEDSKTFTFQWSIKDRILTLKRVPPPPFGELEADRKLIRDMGKDFLRLSYDTDCYMEGGIWDRIGE